MRRSSNKINVYFEIGKKRTFAGSIDWPGWCRSGSDEESALQTLFDYGPRYARVVKSLGFQAPANLSDFVVVERLKGDSTTDFGAPAIAPVSDRQTVNETELQREEKLLKACWRAFDRAVTTAQGKALRVGPRGGGRDLEKIIHHVLDAQAAYLAQIGWKFEKSDELEKYLIQTRQAVLKGLEAASHGELPERGPRGGVHWTPRYFVRRSAWHILDHAWEIEDRVLSEQRTTQSYVPFSPSR